MGQIAEDMIDGTCCELCGCYFDDENGHLYTHEHPAVCWECWSDLSKKEKEIHIRAIVPTL